MNSQKRKFYIVTYVDRCERGDLKNFLHLKKNFNMNLLIRADQKVMRILAQCERKAFKEVTLHSDMQNIQVALESTECLTSFGTQHTTRATAD